MAVRQQLQLALCGLAGQVRLFQNGAGQQPAQRFQAVAAGVAGQEGRHLFLVFGRVQGAGAVNQDTAGLKQAVGRVQDGRLLRQERLHARLGHVQADFRLAP